MFETSDKSEESRVPARRLYLAYGSNLHDWEHDSRLAGLLKPVCRAVLPDHKLGFNRYSSGRKGGVLNIVTCAGHSVIGWLFEVDGDEGWAALDAKEGAPKYYQRVNKVVLDDKGQELMVITYEVTKPEFEEFVRPSESYLNVVREGYTAFGIDPTALEAAAQGQFPG